MNPLQSIEQFSVTQKITMMVNRYEVRSVDSNGKPGELMALAQQKRAAFKEEVRFFSDESKRTLLFSFKARQRLDLGATYDVLDAQGSPLGSFRKNFGASLLRSTWQLDAPGIQAVGSERSQGVAIARRVWEIVPFLDAIPAPFLFHFDFRDPSGQLVLTSERRASLRDRYDVSVPGARLDWRVAAAMAVALDALQSR
jgi:catechol 2,3-dioxygenase-like lactoylglutathione lyase family enzyme